MLILQCSFSYNENSIGSLVKDALATALSISLKSAYNTADIH